MKYQYPPWASPLTELPHNECAAALLAALDEQTQILYANAVASTRLYISAREGDGRGVALAWWDLVRIEGAIAQYL